jgi:flagellar biosynthesis GTPase FlhF
MKTILIAVMLLVLYLLYRIVFPKPIKKQKPTSVLSRQKVNEKEIIGQSRVVLSFQRQAVPVAAKTYETASSDRNEDSFVQENESGQMDISVSLKHEDENEEQEIDPEEEAEELRQLTGSEPELAGGFTFEELEQTVSEVNHPSRNERKAAKVLYRLQDTDCIIQLAAISPEKAERIKSLINLHVNEVESKTGKSENEKPDQPDINGFLS